MIDKINKSKFKGINKAYQNINGNKNATKTILSDNDILSDPETVVSQSINFTNENFTNGDEEKIRRKLKTIQMNFENFIFEKNIKIKNQKSISNKYSNLNKSSMNYSVLSNNSEKFNELSEINFFNFSTCKKFLNEVISLFPEGKNLFEKILIQMDNEYMNIYTKFSELMEKLNLAQVYNESRNLI